MNYGTNALVLDGMIIHYDGDLTNREYVIPAGVTLNGGAFLALDERHAGIFSAVRRKTLSLLRQSQRRVQPRRW